MHIDFLKIENIRNLESIELKFNSKFNLFFGDNASGKSSLIESVVFLASNKSFRTKNFKEVISFDKSFSRVFAKIDDKNIGIERNSTATQIRINKKSIKKVKELSNHIIVQTITPKNADIVSTSANFRRKYIDWGLFHVKQETKQVLQKFNKVLNQRNFLLKNKHISKQEMEVWNDKFSLLGEELSRIRYKHLQRIVEEFNQKYQEFFPLKISFDYVKGWTKNKKLREVLDDSFENDKKSRTTKYGPHMADFKILLKDNKASKQILSRGQNKILSFLLRITQTKLLIKEKSLPVVLLIDDVESELDENNIKILLKCIDQLQIQSIITNVNKIDLQDYPASLFHVKQGEIFKV